MRSSLLRDHLGMAAGATGAVGATGAMGAVGAMGVTGGTARHVASYFLACTPCLKGLVICEQITIVATIHTTGMHLNETS